MALRVRAVLFTLMVPGTVTFLVPYLLSLWFDTAIEVGNFSYVGLPFLLIGAVLYLLSVSSFVPEGRGTPAIWFTRPIRGLIGSEPERLATGGLYRWTRNPMYLGIVLMVFGQGILFDDLTYHFYACVLWVIFHAVVVGLEEPHLEKMFGSAYASYKRNTPRWIGFGGGDPDDSESIQHNKEG